MSIVSSSTLAPFPAQDKACVRVCACVLGLEDALGPWIEKRGYVRTLHWDGTLFRAIRFTASLGGA